MAQGQDTGGASAAAVGVDAEYSSSEHKCTDAPRTHASPCSSRPRLWKDHPGRRLCPGTRVVPLQWRYLEPRHNTLTRLRCTSPPQAAPSDASPAHPSVVDTRQQQDKGGQAHQEPRGGESKGETRASLMPSASSMADEGVLPSPVSTSVSTPFAMDAAYWIPVRGWRSHSVDANLACTALRADCALRPGTGRYADGVQRIRPAPVRACPPRELCHSPLCIDNPAPAIAPSPSSRLLARHSPSAPSQTTDPLPPPLQLRLLLPLLALVASSGRIALMVPWLLPPWGPQTGACFPSCFRRPARAAAWMVRPAGAGADKCCTAWPRSRAAAGSTGTTLWLP